jgi:hypothetical protein
LEKESWAFPPSRPVSTALPAQPITPNRPASFPPPCCCQAGPSALWTPYVSLTPLRAETIMQTDLFGPVSPGKPVPFLCSASPAIADRNSHRLATHASPSSRRIDARHTPCRPVLSSCALMHCGITSLLPACTAATITAPARFWHQPLATMP